MAILVDISTSGMYSDTYVRARRAQMYRMLEGAFEHADVPEDAVHMEDRGDGVLITVAGQIPATRLLGPWLVNVYEELRYENRHAAHAVETSDWHARRPGPARPLGHQR